MERGEILYAYDVCVMLMLLCVGTQGSTYGIASL